MSNAARKLETFGTSGLLGEPTSIVLPASSEVLRPGEFRTKHGLQVDRAFRGRVLADASEVSNLPEVRLCLALVLADGEAHGVIAGLPENYRLSWDDFYRTIILSLRGRGGSLPRDGSMIVLHVEDSEGQICPSYFYWEEKADGSGFWDVFLDDDGELRRGDYFLYAGAQA